MLPKLIPDVIERQQVRTMHAGDSAEAAAREMADHDISAVIVVDTSGALAGIVTERDLTRRVVGAGRLGADVTLGEIMTPDPIGAAPGDSPARALAVMRELNVRHLPVVEERRVLAVVSIRDLQQSVTRQVLTL